MRTTIDLDDDVAAAIERVRREQGLGLSAAVNEIIRKGLVSAPAAPPFRQETHALGITIDVSNVADALEVLEHGLMMVSADSDFARFPELTWLNPFT